MPAFQRGASSGLGRTDEGFANIKAWRRELDNQRVGFRDVARAATPAVARFARDNIIKRIPPDNTSTSGMTNPFPGYAATGALKSSIVAGPVQARGTDSWTAYVGVAVNANRLEKIKAFVHEYGMIIYPRHAKFLRFEIPGVGVVYAKKVRIRAKRFFRSGWYEAQQRFPEILGAFIEQRWPLKEGLGRKYYATSEAPGHRYGGPTANIDRQSHPYNFR